MSTEKQKKALQIDFAIKTITGTRKMLSAIPAKVAEEAGIMDNLAFIQDRLTFLAIQVRRYNEQEFSKKEKKELSK